MIIIGIGNGYEQARYKMMVMSNRSMLVTDDELLVIQ